MSNEKHTPTPWEIVGGGYTPYAIYDAETAKALNAYRTAPRGQKPPRPTGNQLAQVWSHDGHEVGHANAAFIVRACNSHAALVAFALKAASILENNARYLDVAEEGRAALKLAKGE